LPQLWQVFSEFCEGRSQFSADRLTCGCWMLRIFLDRRFSLPQISKRFFPPMLEFRGDQTIVGIALLELTFGERRPITQAFDLLGLSASSSGVGLMTLVCGARQYIQFCWCERLEKRCHGLSVDRIGRDELTHGCAVLLAQVIADIPGAFLVLYDHFVAAFPAIDDAVQERLAFTRHASGFVTVVLSVIITQHALDFLKSFRNYSPLYSPAQTHGRLTA